MPMLNVKKNCIKTRNYILNYESITSYTIPVKQDFFFFFFLSGLKQIEQKIQRQ